MTPAELNLSDGSTFFAARGIREEHRNGVLFVLYEGRWPHQGGTMEVWINPAHIVSTIEMSDD